MYFASLNAAPEWVYQVGSFLVVLVFLLGVVYLALKVWEFIKGDPEPKHTPSVDVKIREQIEAAELRISRASDESEARMSNYIGKTKAELREEGSKTSSKIDRVERELHGRISNLRGELRADYKNLEDKVQAGVDKIQTTYTATVDRMSKVEADSANVARQAIATQNQLQRHIEKNHD
jgi:thiamine kinase-like enzyme